VPPAKLEGLQYLKLSITEAEWADAKAWVEAKVTGI